jgi:hypothetical protein
MGVADHDFFKQFAMLEEYVERTTEAQRTQRENNTEKTIKSR